MTRPPVRPRKDPPLSFGRRLRYLLETGLFFAVIGFFKLFGLDRASALGGWIGRNLIAPTRLSKRARANLNLALPDKSDAERERILYGMWDNLGRVAAEYAHLS